MDFMTISQVSKAYDISARMLRYYEQIGLIKSVRDGGNARRMYDAATLERVRQIIILRKLQIPVKQISVIMNSPDAAKAIDIFRKSIAELDGEIKALSTIRLILSDFIQALEKIADLHLTLDFLQEDSVVQMTGALSLIQRNVKDGVTMSALNEASQALNTLRDVRIVYLPPMTVASAFFVGENSQEKAWRAIHSFVKRSELLRRKPDLRVFRIEHANATGQNFGNEAWVSIPDGMSVPAPLARKRFLGGQYAAHVLGDDGFLTYLGLQDWINENSDYQYDYDGNLTRLDPPMAEIDSFGGTNLDPEEILNYPALCDDLGVDIQYDVLFPVKRRCATDTAPVEIVGSREKCGYRASLMQKDKFRIMGFTKIIGSDSDSPERFEEALKADGRWDALNRHRKPGAPILGFGSHDMDSQMRGGWRWTVCLAESDIADLQTFLRREPYIRTIDAAKGLIFEHARGEPFDAHRVCMKLGYTWNGVISGSFSVWPDGKTGTIDPADENERAEVAYCWYPVK